MVWKIDKMSENFYRELGKALRAFLEDFRKGRKNLEEKGREILQLAQQIKEPHLEKEVKQFVEKLEQFLRSPKEDAQAIAKLALHLEQETREI